MNTVTHKDFLKNIKAYLNGITRNRKPLFISLPSHQDVVVMSRTEYNSMQETLHLIKSPSNAARLLKAVAEDKAHLGTKQQLED